MSGYARHDLIAELDAGIVAKLLVPVFVLGSSFSLIYRLPRKFVLLSFIGLLASMTLTASRAELVFVGSFSVTLLFFKLGNPKTIKKLVLKLFLIAVVFLFGGVLITIYVQRRISPGDFISAITPVISTILEYRAFSFYLAEKAIESSQSFEKVFYPFFGYVSERLISVIEVPSIPIDSKFITELYNLGGIGDYMLANVLYPWWSWFYGVFGELGLLIKAIFIYFLLSFFLKKRMCLSFVYLVFVILFFSTTRHPLLTFENLAYILLVIFIDFKVINKVKKNYEN